MTQGDILLWAIIGLLLINHIRLNFLLRQVVAQNQSLIAMFAAQMGILFNFEVIEPIEDSQEPKTSEEIKKWENGG